MKYVDPRLHVDVLSLLTWRIELTHDSRAPSCHSFESVMNSWADAWYHTNCMLFGIRQMWTLYHCQWWFQLVFHISHRAEIGEQLTQLGSTLINIVQQNLTMNEQEMLVIAWNIDILSLLISGFRYWWIMRCYSTGKHNVISLNIKFIALIFFIILSLTSSIYQVSSILYQIYYYVNHTLRSIWSWTSISTQEWSIK